MTPHQFASLIAIAAGLLTIVLLIWNFWRMKHAYRGRGRQAVERMLKSRGETLVDLQDVAFGEVPVKTGLSATVVFKVRARTADGDERTYEWAYEARVFPWQSEAVKRLAHGIWIPAA
ncbi:hypothetical protein [Phenylobacterium sp.]|uniref:hypothetical protein n=1 Tax=Phenylobacterium sp. TaxID=1871053 RepID=UPI0035659217